MYFQFNKALKRSETLLVLRIVKSLVLLKLIHRSLTGVCY